MAFGFIFGLVVLFDGRSFFFFFKFSSKCGGVKVIPSLLIRPNDTVFSCRTDDFSFDYECMECSAV